MDITELDNIELNYAPFQILQIYAKIAEMISEILEQYPIIRSYEIDNTYAMNIAYEKYKCGQYIKYAIESEGYTINKLALITNQTDKVINELRLIDL